MHHVEQRGISTVIHVDHDLDIATSPVLDAAICLAEADRGRRIVVSLERCSYCDATGLTVLARAKRRNGSNLAIVVPESGRCFRTFEITGLAKSLLVCQSVQRALDAFPPILLEVGRWGGAVDGQLRAAI